MPYKAVETRGEIPVDAVKVYDNDGDRMAWFGDLGWHYEDADYRQNANPDVEGPFHFEVKDSSSLSDLEERVRVLEGIVSDLEAKLATEGGVPESFDYPRYYRIGSQNIYYRVLEPGAWAEYKSLTHPDRGWQGGNPFIGEEALTDRLPARRVDADGNAVTPSKKGPWKLSEVPEGVNTVIRTHVESSEPYRNHPATYLRLADGGWIVTESRDGMDGNLVKYPELLYGIVAD